MKAHKMACVFFWLSSGILIADENDSSGTVHSELDTTQYFFSPTRLGQFTKDIPGTVTVLYRDELLRMGVYTIPEAMRFVPGMSVVESTSLSQSTGHDYKVGYHGGEAFSPRRIQVQLDGMSVYLGSLSKIDWFQLPVTIYEIEKIEVMRNPSAATYGANAFQASINIITRHSADVAANQVDGNINSQKDNFVSYRVSNNLERGTFALTVSRQEDRGFDLVSVMNNDRYTYLDEHARDTALTYRLSGRADVDLSENSDVIVMLGHVSSNYQSAYVFPDQAPGTDADIHSEDDFVNLSYRVSHSKSTETSIRASYKESKFEEEFAPCAPLAVLFEESRDLYTANPKYYNVLVRGGIPSGGTAEDDRLLSNLMNKIYSVGVETAFAPVCGVANQNYADKRAQLSVEQRHVIRDDMRLVSGASIDSIRGTSDTYLGGKESMEMLSVFSNIEWKYERYLTTNLGGMTEFATNVNEIFFSPRASVNWHVNDSLTYRLVFNQSYRTPDLAETDRHWSYAVTDVQPVLVGIDHGTYAISADSDGFQLTAEKVFAVELGLYYQFDFQSFLDFRVFREELDDLISEKPYINDFRLTNSGSGVVEGFEFDGRYRLVSDLSVLFGYSYQDHSESTVNELGLASKHSGSVALSYGEDGMDVTLSYVGNSRMSRESLDKWGITWRETLKFNRSKIVTTLNLSYQPSDMGQWDPVTNDIEKFKDDHNIYGFFGISTEF